MRDAMKAAGRRSHGRINPLLPGRVGHRPQRCRWTTLAMRIRSGRNDPTGVRAQPANVTQFLRWGQKAFRNFKVVPPDTGIVHQVNLECLAKVRFRKRERPGRPQPRRSAGLPRHPGRHRLAHDDDQRPRRARLGRRRDRGRGRHARPADVDAHPRRWSGSGSTGKLRGGCDGHRPRAYRHADPAGRPAWSASSSSSTVMDSPGLTLADRATLGNMSPEYGATCGYLPR